MSELNRLDAKIAINDRIASVNDNLKTRDKLVSKAEALEAELADLKHKESAVLKDETRTDEDKLPDLILARGAMDLKRASIESLRGRPSTGNNTAATLGKIEVVEQAIAKAGSVVSQFLTAFHDAILVNLKATIQTACETFIRVEDSQALWSLASNHPTVRQAAAFSAPIFMKDHQRGYADVVRDARNLEATWENLSDLADSIPGDATISIPEPWLK